MTQDKAGVFMEALARFDWMQVAGHADEPCFCLEDGLFCGRGKTWAGHNDAHKFVSLYTALRQREAAQWGW